MDTRIQRGLAALILFCASTGLRAADGGGSPPSLTWGGTLSSDAHDSANWVGGLVPTSGTPADLHFDGAAPFTEVEFTASLTVNSLRFASHHAYFLKSASGAMLNLGAGGITQDDDGDDATFVDLTYGFLLTLGASQTWTINSGKLSVYSDIAEAVGGTSLTKAGSGELVLGGASTFTGGVTVSAGTLYLASSSHSTLGAIDSGPVGTGRLTLADGVTLAPILNPVSLANDLTLGNNVTFGTAQNTLSLELAGNITPISQTTTVKLLGYAPIAFSGTLGDTHPENATSYQFTSPSLFGAAVLSGANTYTGGTSVDGAAVIFATSSAVPTTGNITVINGGHLGASYDRGPTALLGHVTTPLQFEGTLGLETDPSEEFPTHFSDLLNLSAFDPGKFSGLGTLSSAIFDGTVTPVGGGNYKFGGMGNGTLYVAADLPASGAAGVSVDSYAYAWLTTVLRGNNTFTGDLVVNSASVILDSPNALPAGNHATLSGLTPYLGYTENFTNGGANPVTFAALLGRISFDSGAADPVIGFDSRDLIDKAMGGTPHLGGPTIRTVGDDIDLSLLGTGVYLGSATKAIVTGRIHDGDLNVAGVGSGWIEIAADLTSANTIGRVNVGSHNDPANQNTSAGVVEFSSGASNYSADTSLYAGFLVVSASSTPGSTSDSVASGPLGRGKLQILGDSSLVAGAPSVTLHNWISLGAHRRLQIGVAATTDPTAAAFPLQGLHGNNLTLAGYITGGSNSGLDVYGAGTLTLANENYFSDLKLYDGTLQLDHDQAAQYAKITLENGSDLTFTTATPRIGTLARGYDSSENPSVVSLASGSELTLSDLDGEDFGGSIQGTGAKLILSSDSGSISLSGVNTYTGGTTIESGHLVADSDSALGIGAVNIVGGRLSVGSGVILPNAITFSSNDGFGGHLSGTGTLSGAVTIANDGILSPSWEGSIGKLSFTQGLTFGSGGHYAFDPGDADHLVVPGTDYDTVAITGALNVTSTLAAPFAIDLTDPPEHFDSAQRYSWTVASTTGGITTNGLPTFDAGRFATDTATDDGGYIVTTANEGKNLVLSYLPATIWSGASLDHSFTNSANWQDAAVPASDGTAWIRFDAADPDGTNTIILPSTFSAAKLAFGTAEDDQLDFFLTGATTTTLTLGHGIYSSTTDHDGGGVHVTFDANVNLVLAHSQLVEFGGQNSSIYFQGNISESSSSPGRSFGIAGSEGEHDGDTLRLAGNNTFTGGVFVGQNSRVVVGSDTALGIGGTLTLSDRAAIAADGDRSLANPVVFDGPEAFIQSWNDDASDRLTFTGLVTLNGSLTLISDIKSDVRLAYGIVESTTYASSLTYSNAEGGRLIITNGTGYTGGTRVAQGALIFGPASVPGTGSLRADSGAYIGLADPSSPALTSFLGLIDPINFRGTLGFDSLGSGSNTFSNVNLSGLPNIGSIGTQTFATLSGTLTPAGRTYAFGGGIGTLSVTSVLEDDPSGHTSGGAHAFSLPSESAHASGDSSGARSLTLSGGMKLNLYGNNTYSGGTTVNSGRLFAGSNNAFGTGWVNVTEGFLQVPSGITLPNDIFLTESYNGVGSLIGSGTLAGAVNVQQGGVLSPEHTGIGQLSFTGTLTWSGGGRYLVDLGPISGSPLVAGIDYDTISTHSFTLASTLFNRFNIGFEVPTGLDPTQAYSWKIASTTGGLVDFDTGHLALEDSDRSSQPGFTVSLEANNLYLRYTPQSLWTGSADGTNYATAGNWDGFPGLGTLPPSDGSARLYFGEVGHSNLLLPANLDVSDMEFESSKHPLAYVLGGTGNLTLRNGIQAYSGGHEARGSITFGSDLRLLLANSQTFNGNVTYRFQGPVGETAPLRTLILGDYTTAYFSGANTYTGGTFLGYGATAIFANDAAVPSSGTISSASYGYAYVGLPSVAAVGRLSTDFSGTLGLESFGGSTTDFAGLNVSAYQNLTSVGSSTSALLSGVFDPGTSATAFQFGRGGGKLTVSANLGNGSATRSLLNTGDLTLLLTGTNTFTGGLVLLGGRTVIGSASALPASGPVVLSAGAYFGYSEGYTAGYSAAFFDRAFVLNGGAMLGIDSSDVMTPQTISTPIDLSRGGDRASTFFVGTSSKLIVTGAITPTTDKILSIGATTGGYLVFNSTLTSSIINSLVVGSQNFTGTVELGGANTFTGGTTVEGGMLIVASNSALGATSSPVTVRQGGRLSIANGVTLSNSVTFASGATKALLSGNGTYGTPVTLGDGGGMAPGNSVGHLHFAAGLTWSGGGGYEVEVQDVSTAAGVGYDTASVTGTLAFTATIGSPFTIYLKSLTSAGAAGNVANFVDSVAYTWFIADATTLTGFGTVNADTLKINPDGFTNAFTGTFGLTTSGNSVLLQYTPAAVPEPSTWALLLTGAAAVALLSRRRRRA